MIRPMFRLKIRDDLKASSDWPESVGISLFYNIIMQPASSVYLRGKLLKVRFHCLSRPKSKAFQLSTLTFPQLLAALVDCFKLQSSLFYQLSYHDEQGDTVAVSTEADFDSFLEHAKNLVLELMPTSGQHNDFRRNVDLPKVDKIDSKHSEDVSAELELCKDKLKQLEEEIRVLRTEKLKQDKKMAEQELEIERLRERNNSEALDEKKQELLAEFQKYKVDLRDKYATILQEKLQEKLKQMKGQQKIVVDPEPDKKSIESKARKEKVSMLAEILSVEPKIALKLVRDNPDSDLQTLVAIHYSQ